MKIIDGMVNHSLSITESTTINAMVNGDVIVDNDTPIKLIIAGHINGMVWTRANTDTEISGFVTGDVRNEGKLTITGTGQVLGKIHKR